MTGTATNQGGIRRERVTWCRWDARRRRQVVTHPWWWAWTDPDGYERYYDTKREAEQARKEAAA